MRIMDKLDKMENDQKLLHGSIQEMNAQKT